jgi:hypothetical protein
MGNETNSPYMPQTCYNNPFFKYFYERVRNGVRNFIFSLPLCKNRGHNDLSCSDALERTVQIPLSRKFVHCREIACNLQWQGNYLRFTGSRKLHPQFGHDNLNYFKIFNNKKKVKKVSHILNLLCKVEFLVKMEVRGFFLIKKFPFKII